MFNILQESEDEKPASKKDSSSDDSDSDESESEDEKETPKKKVRAMFTFHYFEQKLYCCLLIESYSILFYKNRTLMLKWWMLSRNR